MLTGEQLRAARAILKMERAELAKLANVSVETIKRLERMEGALMAQASTLTALQSALAREGIIFIPENGGLPGVRLRRDPPASIRQRQKRGSSDES